MSNFSVLRLSLWIVIPLGGGSFLFMPSLVAQMVKNPPTIWETWLEKIPWRREWQPTPVFLAGEFHGQGSMVGYSPWGCKWSDTSERLRMHACISLCAQKVQDLKYFYAKMQNFGGKVI